jgi:hypothetical protein
MTTLQQTLYEEINTLSLVSQKEVLDFVLFLKKQMSESDNDFLSKNPNSKQAIIDGLNTPLSECSETLDW